ncbi:MAG: hypothetical protein M3388_01890 [Acidobacteriota bacterium]|nr:hypothetical protein [Acidobacteriota bacterium]
MKLSDKTWRVIIASIFVVYFLLRLWNLTDSCLWFDEIFSVHAAELDWQNLVWLVAQDLIHPPLFYFLLKIWIVIGGENLFWLRFFPVFFSILAVVPFLFLCRELKLNFLIIALALTFFAASGSLIKYAQEVRMYSLVLFFGLFSMWFFARFFYSGKNLWSLTLINILLVYTHYFGWFIIASEVAAILILQRTKARQILLMSAVTALNFAPWIFALLQASKINSNVAQNIGWMTKPNFAIVLQFVFDLFEPIYFEQSSADKTAILLITLPILAIVILAFGFYLAVWKSETKTDKHKIYLLLIFIFVPLLAAFVASWILPYSIWGTRHLSIVFAPTAILFAIALTKIRFWQLKTASLSLIFLLFGAAFLLQATRAEPKYIWCAWENLVLSLRQTQNEINEPTKIYVFEDLVAYHFWFALRDSDSGFRVVKVNGIAGLTEDKAYFLPRGFDEVQTINENEIEGERFFIAFRDKDWNEFAPPLQNLKAKGYQIGEPQVFESQGLKAFLLEVRK